MLCVLKFQSLSISLLLKLTDQLLRGSTWSSCFARSDLAWLSKWSLMPSRRDLPTFDGSVFLKMELLNWFLGSALPDEDIAADFPDALGSWDELDIKLFSSVSLSTLCTYFSLLYCCRKFYWCSWYSRWITVLSTLHIQCWSQHFFVILHLQDPSLQCSPLSHDRNASVIGHRTYRNQLFQIPPYLQRYVLVVIPHESFLYLIRICPKIPVKLNSSGLEVFRLDEFGLITCERWDLRWSATLPWTIAGKIFIVYRRSCVCWWGRRKDGRGEWERTCACGQCQVRQRMRHDTWMTIVLRHKDVRSWALQLLSHACSRDEMWSCCTYLYVLFLWVYCSHGLEVICFLVSLSQTMKIHPVVFDPVL